MTVHEAEERQGCAAQQVSVYLVTSHHAASVGVQAIVQQSSSLRLCGVSRHADEAVFGVRAHRPSVVFVSTDMAGRTVEDLTQELRAICPETKIIVVGEEYKYDTLVALGQVPIDGYVSWRRLDEDVVDISVAAVTKAGLRIADPEAVDELVAPRRAQGHQGNNGIGLTDREQDALEMIVNGALEREIGERLHVEQATVERMTHTLKRKLDAHTLCELGAKAVRLNLVA